MNREGTSKYYCAESPLSRYSGRGVGGEGMRAQRRCSHDLPLAGHLVRRTLTPAPLPEYRERGANYWAPIGLRPFASLPGAVVLAANGSRMRSGQKSQLT